MIASNNQPLEPIGENQVLKTNSPSHSQDNQVSKDTVGYGTFRGNGDEVQQQQSLQDQSQVQGQEQQQVPQVSSPSYIEIVEKMVEPYLGTTEFNVALIAVIQLIVYLFYLIGIPFVFSLVLAYILSKFFDKSITETYKRKIVKIQEKLMIPNLENDIESVLWINRLLSGFWFQFEPKLCKQLVDNIEATVEPYLASVPIIKKVKFTTFTLGNKPPILKGIKYYPSNQSDIIIMDWHLSFTPNSFYEKKFKSNDSFEESNLIKINSNIQLEIELNLFGMTFKLPIILNEMHFNSKLRIKLKLMNNFPHIKSAHVSLLELPDIDFKFRPIFNIDLTNIPFFKPLFNRLIKQIIESIILAPQSYLLNIEEMMGSSLENDLPIGVLKLTINNATGLKNVELIGIIDPFVSINIEDRKELFKTKTIQNTTNPVWDQTFDILIYSLNEKLNMIIKDENDVKKDRVLGLTQFDLSTLLNENNQNNCDKIIRNGKIRGDLTYKLSYYPVVEAIKLEDGTEEIIQSNSGVMKIIIRQIQGLEKQRKLLSSVPVVGGGKSKVTVNVKINGYSIYQTKSYDIMNLIVIESFTDQFIDDINTKVVTLELLSSNHMIGQLHFNMNQFLDEINKEDGWFEFNKNNDKEKSLVKIKLDAKWSSILMDATSHGNLPPAIGFLRVKIIRAKDLKCKESATKNTQLIELKMNNKIWGTSEKKEASPNPYWDEVFYIPIHQIKEILRLEIKGSSALKENKSYGYVELPIKDFIGNQYDNLIGFEDGELISKWHTVINKKDSKNDGSIELMVQYFSLPQQFLQPKVDKASKKSSRKDTSMEKSTIDQQSISVQTSHTNTINEPTNSIQHSNSTSVDQQSNSALPSISNNINQQYDSPAPTRSNTVDQGAINNNNNSLNQLEANNQSNEMISTTNTIVMSNKNSEDNNYLNYSSGIIKVKLHEVKDLQSKTKIYGLITLNGNFRSPILRTLVKKSNLNQSWGESGEGFVKETQVDMLNVEIKQSKENEDKTIASWNGRIKDILESIKNNQFNNDKNNEDKNTFWYNLDCPGQIKLSFEFIPSNYIIDESESSRNMGILQVRVIKAADLVSADKDGSSDPYVSLSLNGNKKLRTKTKKNNLNPTFDELFNIEVTDRIKSILAIEVFDWNQIQSHSSLGSINLELKQIEAEIKDEVTLQLENTKHGSITLELFFAPFYVLRDVNPSLLAAALSGNPVDLVGGLAKGGFKVATGGLSLALGGAAHLANGTGKVAIQGAKTVLSAPLKLASGSKNIAKGIFNSIKDTIHHDDHHNNSNTTSPPTVTLTDSNNNSTSPLNKIKSGFNSSTHSISSTHSGSFGLSSSRSPSRQGNNESGYSVKITLLDGKDLIAADRNGYSDPYIKVMKEKKLIYKTKVLKKTRNPHWDESFIIQSIYPGELTQLNLIIKDYNFLKENVELGSYTLNIWDHFKNDQENVVEFLTNPGELRNGGVGQLRLKLELNLPGDNSGLNTSNSHNSPTNVNPVLSQEMFEPPNEDSINEEESDKSNRRLKRNSIANLKPKNLLGSLKEKFGKN
ncbi:hypothetical protein K502DRAFT_322489 [Neoconidiobolus thromboides FSU 785]|nr:hypothetical protein K502DRAFT_322489 [Neoconidiobolus thromboides FSU 785]